MLHTVEKNELKKTPLLFTSIHNSKLTITIPPLCLSLCKSPLLPTLNPLESSTHISALFLNSCVATKLFIVQSKKLLSGFKPGNVVSVSQSMMCGRGSDVLW